MLKLDTINKKILEILQQNAKTPISIIVNDIGLSYTSTYNRINTMKTIGVISRYTTILNRKKIGLQISAFVRIKLKNKTTVSRIFIESELQSQHEVQTLVAMSGNYDYLLKVIARDLEHLYLFLLSRLGSIDSVSHFESSIVLSEVKSGNLLPL